MPAGQSNPEDPVTGLRNPLFLQCSQGVMKRHCLEARTHPLTPRQGHGSVCTGGCAGVLESTGVPFCELAREEVFPSGVAFSPSKSCLKPEAPLRELPALLRKMPSGFLGSDAHPPGNLRSNGKTYQALTRCTPEVEKEPREGSSLMAAGARVRAVLVRGEGRAWPRMGDGVMSKCTADRRRQVSYSWKRGRNRRGEAKMNPAVLNWKYLHKRGITHICREAATET